MPNHKSKSGKKNRSPFCRGRKKLKTRKKTNEGRVFPDERKNCLAQSDLGSYFQQDAQWPELFPDNNDESCSRSKSKLNESMESLRKRKAAEPDSESFSDSDSSSGSEDESTSFQPTVGRYIVDPECVQVMLDNSAVCKFCHSPLHILEKVKSRQGLGAKWIFCCTSETCVSHKTRASVPISECSGQKYTVNACSVAAFRAIGKGRAAAEKCLSMMDLSSPIFTWSKYTKELDTKSKELTDVSMKDAVFELRKFKRCIGEIPDCTDDQLKNKMVDCAASFDCSWSSRGWSARDGVVAAISEDTGKVLDVVFMTSSCPHCKMMADKRTGGELTRLEFLDWYIKHEPDCQLNHDGSAQSMEAGGVSKLYSRSIEKHNARYIPFIGDGDSSSYSRICIEKPYGPSVYIPKVDCIAHVTKRMGSNLRSLIRDFKGKKLADGKGLGGAGRLTIARIDTIQSFYGLCIRQNKGDAKAMSKATKAILLHYSSTEENPQHDCCPVGPTSWCSFQRDLANKTKSHRCIKDPLPPAVVNVIKPVFEKLGDEKFLGGCERCATQNANESLHHVIWGFAPKEQHTSQIEASLGINLGVLIFNCGMEVTYSQLLPMIGVKVTDNMRKGWNGIDRKRIYGGEYKERSEVKERRKRYKRLKSKKADAFLHKEGVQYQSQAFYSTNEEKGAGKGKGKGKAKVTRKGKRKKASEGKK